MQTGPERTRERKKGEVERTKSNCSSKFLELRNVSRIFTFEVIFFLEEFVCSHFLAEISRELSEEGKPDRSNFNL